MARHTIDLNRQQENALDEIQEFLGSTTKSWVIRKGLALLHFVAKHGGESVKIVDEKGEEKGEVLING